MCGVAVAEARSEGLVCISESYAHRLFLSLLFLTSEYPVDTNGIAIEVMFLAG